MRRPRSIGSAPTPGRVDPRDPGIGRGTRRAGSRDPGRSVLRAGTTETASPRRRLSNLRRNRGHRTGQLRVGVWRRTVRPSRVPPVGTGVPRRHERLMLLRRVRSGRTAAWTRTRARRWRAVERPAEGQCGETHEGVRRNGGDGTVGRSPDCSRRGPPVSVQFGSSTSPASSLRHRCRCRTGAGCGYGTHRTGQRPDVSGAIVRLESDCTTGRVRNPRRPAVEPTRSPRGRRRKIPHRSSPRGSTPDPSSGSTRRPPPGGPSVTVTVGCHRQLGQSSSSASTTWQHWMAASMWRSATTSSVSSADSSSVATCRTRFRLV